MGSVIIAVAISSVRSFGGAAPYQLAFMTPGTWPRLANVRKQMRHMSNLRR